MISAMSRPDVSRGFFCALLADGRPVLSLTGIVLILSGGFAIFQSMTGHFLPHDEAFLGMTAHDLCRINECRVVHFMFHDRVSFGGAIIAVGLLYLWLAEFPLRDGEAWAWWLFALSGGIGFASFLTYLRYGYLDTWHGVATLMLFPCFVGGLWISWSLLRGDRGFRTLRMPGERLVWRGRYGLGKICLLVTAIFLVVGGLTIMTFGSTVVFVPQDIEFMKLTAADLTRINPRLVPLIAHDRAGFGGGLASIGVLVFFCIWCGKPSRSLWQATALAGGVGFATAIGVHPVIGYNSLSHIGPAIMLACVFVVGLVLTAPRMLSGSTTVSPEALVTA
jgi:hypothetical protein